MKYVKILLIMLMVASVSLCCRYYVTAAELLPDGKALPDFPDDIYGKNYVLMYRTTNGGELWLYILPDDGIVKMTDYTDPRDSYSGTGQEVINFKFPDGTLFYSYSYISQEWTYGGSSNLSGTQTPVIYIFKNTVDIYYSGDTSIVYRASNSDIIFKKKIKFDFIKNPESTTDMIYNLLVMNSIALYGYIGYRCIKKTFARIRTLRSWKGERKC